MVQVGLQSQPARSQTVESPRWHTRRRAKAHPPASAFLNRHIPPHTPSRGERERGTGNICLLKRQTGSQETGAPTRIFLPLRCAENVTCKGIFQLVILKQTFQTVKQFLKPGQPTVNVC